MSRYDHADNRDGAGAVTGVAPSSDDGGKSWEIPPDGGTSPHLRVRAVERTALVRFVDAEVLFEEEAVRAVGQWLHRLVREDGHTRLVVNLAGVRYVSSEVLGTLAAVQQEVGAARGRITLCGLEPLLRDMLRITGLDRVFDICIDEVEALGLIAR